MKKKEDASVVRSARTSLKSINMILLSFLFHIFNIFFSPENWFKVDMSLYRNPGFH